MAGSRKGTSIKSKALLDGRQVDSGRHSALGSGIIVAMRGTDAVDAQDSRPALPVKSDDLVRLEQLVEELWLDIIVVAVVV
jgi:hypothetical protein